MNRSRLKIWVLLAAAAVLIPMRAHGQAEPSGYQDKASLWVGADYVNMRASFPYESGKRLSGVGTFVDFNWSTHLSVEGEAQFLHWGSFEGDSESSYLAGPRFRFNRIGPFRPYAKALVGVGHIHFPFEIGDATYFAVAPGAGAAYPIHRRWLIRAEYEYQLWLNSPGFSDQPDHPFHPNGFKIGMAFRP
jgi:opacity protein-like surface antigen